jgi:hypothetical protein
MGGSGHASFAPRLRSVLMTTTASADAPSARHESETLRVPEIPRQNTGTPTACKMKVLDKTNQVFDEGKAAPLRSTNLALQASLHCFRFRKIKRGKARDF